MERGCWSVLADVLFPRACAGCGAAMAADPGYCCWDCLRRLEWVRSPLCVLCGDPLEGRVAEPVICSACRAHWPAFDRARSAVRFGGLSRDLLHAFKYRHATWLDADFVRWMEPCYRQYFAAAQLDTVTYVPLHPTRERERSYNQARLLARGLAARVPGLRVRPLLRRVRLTPSQTRLTARDRLANVHGVFTVAHPDAARARRVLLVDDVMTTGATVNECARVLKEAGAALVGVLTVGRG